jgi:hypothetical protein
MFTPDSSDNLLAAHPLVRFHEVLGQKECPDNNPSIPSFQSCFQESLHDLTFRFLDNTGICSPISTHCNEHHEGISYLFRVEKTD